MAPPSLKDLAWSEFFNTQLTPEDAHLTPRRIAEVHRARLSGLGLDGQVRLTLPHMANTGDYAVGDWVLTDPDTHLLVRRLERKSLIKRRIEGKHAPQLGAANVDTLFIVTSCNADFNPARLERYLAMANEAGTVPVMVLTKADTVEDAKDFERQALALQRDLVVVALNARSPQALDRLRPWCGEGQTVALAGSSGVGKSTLVNTLSGAQQLTGDIREHDAKGRHTTTARSLHATVAGGWIIDTPGMRNLHLADVTYGLETLFSEITDLAPKCRFRDCTHAHEPGCAVQAAIASGDLTEDRLTRWRKLSEENISNTQVLTGPRGNRKPDLKKR